MYRILFLTSILFFKISSAQNLEKLADSIITKNEIPEMTFAVVTKDSILIQRTIGHHKITEFKDKQNANSSDLFHLGSNTKAITGFISAHLVEKKENKMEH